jgi:hypothetical protein
MTLAQNQFSMVPVAGQRVSGDNVKQCEFYDASASATIAAGEFVLLSTTTAPGVTKVKKGSAATDKYVGVVLTNALKADFAVGDLMDVAWGFTEVMCTASAAITAGASLEYDYATGKVYTKGASDTVVGLAMEDAASANDLVRVLVQTNF